MAITLVRKESAYLAGWVSWGEADKQRTMALENLKADCKSLKRKIVFRSDPRKFVKLKYECEEFLKMVVTSVGLIKDVDSMDKQQISDQVRNWQLIRGKGQSNSLSSSEKLELWEKLKILSFTRMVLSLWAMTMLSLYIRVQVNILGRHLYIDTARDLGSSHLLFLASADFLSNYGMPTLISNMQATASEQLKDLFNTTVLHETTVQILDMFMSMGSPHH
ncbi:hypothetical protein CsSME_00010775 [Camellia sinensis var. sinensis]